MEIVDSLEKQLVETNKGLPKLPAGLTKWLADYGWLLTLISVVLGALSLLALIPAALLAFGLSTAVGVGYGLSGYGYSPLVSSFAWLSILLSLVNLILIIVIEAMAISPLKAKKHRGWQLVFIASLISLIFSVASNLVTMQLSSLVVGLVAYALGLYVLFQLRPHFLPHTAHDKKAEHKPAFKPAEKKAEQ